MNPLDFKEERRGLKSLFEKLDLVDIRFKSSHCDVKNFLEAYAHSMLLHISAHGTEDGNTAFEQQDDLGATHWVHQTGILDMCCALESKPQLVFLSCCFSEKSCEAFKALGIPHVITVAMRVKDKAAMEFTHAFYSELLSGKSVEASFNHARGLLVTLHPEEKDKFGIFGDGDHSISMFQCLPTPVVRTNFDETVRLPPSNCNSSAAFSLGREVEVQKVI